MLSRVAGSGFPVGLYEVGAVVMRFINDSMQHVHRKPEKKSSS